MGTGFRWAGRLSVVLGLGTVCLLGGIALLQGASTAPASPSGDAPVRPAGAVAEAASGTASGRAWTWLQSLTHAPSAVTTPSTITPARDYPVDWTGPVAGSFALTGVTPPATSSAAVELDAASTSAARTDSYRGAVTGRVTLTPSANRWILQAYRVTDGQARQYPAQALAAADGTFRLDLSGGGDPGSGRWEIGVLDATAAYAPTGQRWPAAAAYTGWEVRSFAVTDRPYLLGATPARADGTFEFAASAPGRKMFQLVAVGDGRESVLAEYRPSTGLIRTPDGHPEQATAHAYDQALAVQTALVMGDGAATDLLTGGLLRLQTGSGAQRGGFVATAPQATPEAAAPIYRTGGHAVATYALLSAIRSLPATDPRQGPWRSAAAAAIDWLMAQRLAQGPNAGLFTGGWGTDAAPTARIEWVSTEHNLDAWQALDLASSVLSCGSCRGAADALQATILQRLWQPAGGFVQGAGPDGLDTVRPLDVQTWGAIWLTRIGRGDLAAVALADVPAYRVTDQNIAGLLAFKPQPAIQTPAPTVWFEGTFGYAMAQVRAGDTAGQQATLAALAAGQRADGSFPVATTADPERELTTQPSVAATAWFLLAQAGTDPRGLWF